jgi:hypothetical protein
MLLMEETKQLQNDKDWLLTILNSINCKLEDTTNINIIKDLQELVNIGLGIKNVA